MEGAGGGRGSGGDAPISLSSRSFFIKHKGARTKTYSGCKRSKCQLAEGGRRGFKKIIIRFITQINGSSQPFKSSPVFAAERRHIFSSLSVFSRHTRLPLDSGGVILEVLYS